MEAGGSQFTKCQNHTELDNVGTKRPQIDPARIWGYRKYYPTLTRHGGNITREHHDKAVIGEYRIPKPPNKPGGYVNLGVSAALILVAAISKRLAAG